MKLRAIIKERWKFYLVTYLIGYIVSLTGTGAPNFVYLIPVKLLAIALAILLGNGFYWVSKGKSSSDVQIKSIKYILICAAVMIAFRIAQPVLQVVGIDITPLLGFKV